MGREVKNKVFGISDQVDTNRPVLTRKKVRNFEVKWKRNCTIVVASENKGADQLCSYCTADLHLCFRIRRLLVF